MGLFDMFRKKKEKTDYMEAIMSKLSCDCESVEVNNSEMVMAYYLQTLKQGKKEGYIPLFILPSEMMVEIVDAESNQEFPKEERESILQKAKKINAQELLSRLLEDVMPEEEEDHDISGEFSIEEPVNQFQSLGDVIGKKIIMAKIPTDKPWEVAAWVPMGGFNECPAPEEQMAVLKHWYEKYGAVPALVTSDVWELYIDHPLTTQEQAEEVAWEQFGFCGDIVYQGTGDVRTLAGTIINSSVWYFWWD